jgi:hypothetical protein
MEKIDLKPLHNGRQCRAKSKRSRFQCKNAAVKGKLVCRMHGARSGAPHGPRNGRWKDGAATNEVKAERQVYRAILALCRSDAG